MGHGKFSWFSNIEQQQLGTTRRMSTMETEILHGM
eukprot:COSAG02_NODE_4011_length_5913_cov_2.229618_1_plen_34_part_10